MKKYYNQIIQQLDDEVNELKIDLEDSMEFYELAIDLTIKYLQKLKNFTSKEGFHNEQEEIHFFKHLKPHALSKLIYYNAIYKIETKKPYGTEKTLKKYLNNELNKIKRFFDNNLEFYKYYRTNSIYLDHKYFVRRKHDIKLNLDTYYFEADHDFSTTHDYKVAKIIANDLIQVYLEDQIYNNNKKKQKDVSILNWTDSKAALIELIYAIYAKGAVNNGNADIKVIAKTFEMFFNIDLGDFYHTYLELKGRKLNRTKFLDALREILLKKMDEQDEK